MNRGSALARTHRVRPAALLRAVLPLVAATLLLPTHAFATRYAGEFLRIGVGARALGMGSAFVGLADDGTAAYWNPAGLATLERREATAMHAEQFGSIVKYDFLSFAMPIGDPGKARQSLGFSFIRLGVDDIPDTRGLEILDQNGNGRFDYPEDRLVVDESRFIFNSDNDVALLISYAREIRPGLSVGGNFKMIRQWLGDSLRSNGFGLDAGVLWLGPSGWSLGAKLSDATTTRILWNTGTNEFIAPSLRIGGAKTRAFGNRKHIVTAALDVQVGFSDERLSSQAHLGGVTFEFHPGVEYWIERRLALRAGMEARNFSAGGGIRVRRFGLDYAYLDHRDLDSSHRVSASYAF
ncbi:MAG TPA: PorV/PorQ family protein [Candidatus Eisenbacteria bacterium]|nr:PorV/PorQ family protein [Candidatus Eisenbacteria bacterium]